MALPSEQTTDQLLAGKTLDWTGFHSSLTELSTAMIHFGRHGRTAVVSKVVSATDPLPAAAAGVWSMDDVVDLEEVSRSFGSCFCNFVSVNESRDRNSPHPQCAVAPSAAVNARVTWPFSGAHRLSSG